MGDKRLKPKLRQRRRLRQLTLFLGFLLVLYCFFFVWRSPSTDGGGLGVSTTKLRLTPELLNNLSLDEGQCKAAFPGITKDIDDVVAQGPFKIKQIGDLGPVQARIKDGQLHIIYAQRKSDLSREMLNVRLSPTKLTSPQLTQSYSPAPPPSTNSTAPS